MKTLCLAMLAAFSTAIETSTEQMSSQLEQIKIELPQTASDTEHLGFTGSCTDAPACADGYWLDITTCQCAVNPTQCPTGFGWTGSECVCLDPGCPPDHVWEYHECRCVCEEFKPAGFCDSAALNAQFFPSAPAHTWFWDSCSCSCQAEPIACSPDTATVHWIYNSDIGDCVCAPLDILGCGVGFYFDSESCDCRCTPRQCQPGFDWDVDACDCKCN